MLSLTSLLALLAGTQAVSAQSFTVTSYSESTFAVFPTGVADGLSRVESTLPLACAPGCLPVTPSYYACFINTTQLDGSTIPEDFCDNFFCSQGNYTQLLDCANCIVANGNERPYGYYSNTSLTAAPTDNGNPAIPYNPLGLVDADQVNGWLKNVTERCSSINRAVTGASSITATPTTTGPYFTSFTSGQTQILPTWTGLTQYPPPVQTLRIPADQIASEQGSSASSGSGTGSSTSGAASSATSSTAASASSTPNNAMMRKGGSAGLSLMGLGLAYVVGL